EERADLLVHEREGPSAALESSAAVLAGSAEPLHDSVERYGLGHGQLHGRLLSSSRLMGRDPREAPDSSGGRGRGRNARPDYRGSAPCSTVASASACGNRATRSLK